MGLIQNGPLAKLSCETQLVELVADFSKELDNGEEVDACLLDFSKVFEKVSHAKLLAEMTSMGICEQITNWTVAFLRDRTQIVTLQGASSTPCPVTSGAQQESVVTHPVFCCILMTYPTR